MNEDCAEVDVVIVSYNDKQALSRAVASLESIAGIKIRVIVVDNASSDGTIDSEALTRTTVIPLPRNVGYGGAFNIGLDIATAPWVVCANQDVEVTPDALSTLIEAAQSYETRAGVPCVVAPQLVTSDGEIAETCHRIPTLARQMMAFLIGEEMAGVRNNASDGEGPQRCEWVSAAFILASRSTFESVSGFDSAYFMYVEDLDFFTRLAREGMHCVWVPRARVVHFGGRSNTVKADVHGRTLLNWRRYFATHQGPFAGKAIVACGIAGSLLRAGVWWVRSWNGDRVARARASAFFGGALVALRHTSPAPDTPARSDRLNKSS